MGVPQIKTLSEFNKITFEFHEGDFDCPVHGTVNSRYWLRSDGTKQWDECPMCAQKRQEEEERKRIEANKKALHERYALSRVKAKFYAMNFANYKIGNDSQSDALEKVALIAGGSSNRSLLLLGPNGVGKTMLASIAVMQRGGAIYKMYEIGMRIKASYKNSSTESEQDILTELAKLPLLVIDEVGRQFGSESEKNWLSYVIDERYADDLPTILISNLKLSSECSKTELEQGVYIEHYLGKDSVSRLVECADIVTVTGDDYRRRNKA